MSLSNEANQRGLKDFLTLYNTITEYCFNKCVSNFNERSTLAPENSCINVCTDNYVQFNQRFMFNFVDQQERRKRELEITAKEVAAKEAAEAAKVAAEEAANAAAVAAQQNNDTNIENIASSPMPIDHSEASSADSSINIVQQQQHSQDGS